MRNYLLDFLFPIFKFKHLLWLSLCEFHVPLKIWISDRVWLMTADKNIDHNGPNKNFKRFLVNKLLSRSDELKISPMFWLQENLILMKEMLNWLEDHSWRNSFLKNPYFSRNARPENIILNRLVNMHKKWVWVWAMIWFWVCYRSWTCYSETRLASVGLSVSGGPRGGGGYCPPLSFSAVQINPISTKDDTLCPPHNG